MSHSAILHIPVVETQVGHDTSLHIDGQFVRLYYFGAVEYRVDDDLFAQLVPRSFEHRFVLTCRNTLRLCIPCRLKKEGLHSVYTVSFFLRYRIGMNGDEYLGILFIGDTGSLREL